MAQLSMPTLFAVAPWMLVKYAVASSFAWNWSYMPVLVTPQRLCCSQTALKLLQTAGTGAKCPHRRLCGTKPVLVTRGHGHR